MYTLGRFRFLSDCCTCAPPRSLPDMGKTEVYDTAQTPCARMLARKDVAEETKKHLIATRAELDLTSLLHAIFLCQEEATSGDQETSQLRDHFS